MAFLANVEILVLVTGRAIVIEEGNQRRQNTGEDLIHVASLRRDVVAVSVATEDPVCCVVLFSSHCCFAGTSCRCSCLHLTMCLETPSRCCGGENEGREKGKKRYVRKRGKRSDKDESERGKEA